jgi:hypothetical protein
LWRIGPKYFENDGVSEGGKKTEGKLDHWNEVKKINVNAKAFKNLVLSRNESK